MSLVDYLGKRISETKASFSRDSHKWTGYLTDKQLKGYFGENFSKKPESELTEDEKRLKGGLETILNKKIDKYKKELGGMVRKVGTKGLMAADVANRIYGMVSDAPIRNISQYSLGLFGAKTLLEAPAMVRYVKKSGDWYGALKHYTLKTLKYWTPIIGPALESGAFERMVRKRVMRETASDFVKEFGKYEKLNERLEKAKKQKLGNVMQMPTRDYTHQKAA